ncbi:class I SAM-dependent methyltransferase [Bacillus pinisoli]|uniref:class I SAM-dependent methyltransferase n=1 Tax=Bacillus pinisoli TaxID=2901866 RepID=UPI001FF62A82|nr:class I SAM-dependent methyltransferase [Bacillus pinisoli]
MSEHYYSRNPSVESKQQSFSYTLRGHSLTFTTDQGVFSKAEIDFGSRLLIDSIQIGNVAGNILDVGCGYGPIGITIAKEFPDRVVEMVDVNERALGLAEQNAKNNAVENIEVYYSNALNDVRQERYAAVITNPPIRAGKKVVHEIFEEGFNRLVVGGDLWIVIQKKQGAPSAIEKLKTLTPLVETVAKSKGYFILKATRKSS